MPGINAKVCAVLLSIGTMSPALAGDIVAFDQIVFSEMQNAGRSIVIDVTAPWCPTCRKQAPIIESLANDPAFAEVVVFKVDFDSSKKILREWHVAHQSTLIAFKGKAERLRSNAQTDRQSIRKIFEAAL